MFWTGVWKAIVQGSEGTNKPAAIINASTQRNAVSPPRMLLKHQAWKQWASFHQGLGDGCLGA
jgi:hypothetical protein